MKLAKAALDAPALLAKLKRAASRDALKTNEVWEMAWSKVVWRRLRCARGKGYKGFWALDGLQATATWRLGVFSAYGGHWRVVRGVWVLDLSDSAG
jgi:hypothetical protein